MKISIAQRNILDRIASGMRLAYDPGTGRYSLFKGDTICTVDQRPVDTMLTKGVLEKDAIGQCRIAEGMDIAGSTVVRKTHLLGVDGQAVVCRYSKHPRALSKRLSVDDFRKLPTPEQCPACLNIASTIVR